MFDNALTMPLECTRYSLYIPLFTLYSFLYSCKILIKEQMVFYDIFANGIFTTVLVLESVISFDLIYCFRSETPQEISGVDL